MKLMTFLKKISNPFMKLDKWTKAALIFGIVLILLMLANMHIKQKEGFIQREGFIQKEKFIIKKGSAIYDNFYCSIYDDLVLDKIKNDFEVGEIRRIIPTDQSRVLDIGSGKGHHVKLLNKAGYNAEGLDKSPAMVAQAKQKYKKYKFKNGDVMESILYPSNTFTAITCLYFTIYYIKDKTTFFKNCYNWLKPGGYLVIHLVNRDKFDPILNTADPLHLISAQKYAKKRITNSLIKFKDFQYKANFDLDKNNNLAEFNETLKDDKTGNVRQNKHKFFMDTQKHILGIAKNTGFILKVKIDMIATQYQYQYLYILYKPQ